MSVRTGGFLCRRTRGASLAWLGACLILAAAVTRGAFAAGAVPEDFSGVWLMIQHSRPGAPFFIPVEPPLNAKGKAVTEAFAAKYHPFKALEANANCVEPGMPTVMWGIGGAAMEIVQQPQRITLLSELANQSRRIYLDGRAFPTDFPTQRVGYSIGHWEGKTLVIETRLTTEWDAPRWPHSDKMRIVERWSMQDPSKFKIVGLRADRPPPKIEGKILVNEMTMSDPEFYVNDAEVVTVLYRRAPNQVMLEDNCTEGVWMERLEQAAAAGH